MKRSVSLLLSLSLASSLHAQTTSLPTTLPALAQLLPTLVHNKQFDFGPFSEAFMNALQRDPASVDAAIPIIAEDLSDPDQNVRFHTTSLLYGIETVRRDSGAIFAPLYSQLAKATTTGDASTQAITMMVIEGLGQQTPDLVVDSIKELVRSRPTSDKVMAVSVGALMAARPADDAAQGVVIELLSDSTLSPRQREIVLDSAARAGGGPRIEDFVVQQANTATDRTIRDTAFSAATFLGVNALNRISDRLTKVAQDLKEPPQEREIARHALSVRARLSNQ